MDKRSFSDIPLLEIACFNQESAFNAARGGADRIELCCDYMSGGLSPAATTLAALKSQISVPIHVMIRPHSEGFCYNDESFEAMKTSLVTFKNLGADGYVFGILGPVSESPSQDISPWIDVSRNKELVQLAEGKPCTFHRAFDCIPESHWDAALADMVKCGFASILTSGGPSSDRAIDCIDKLADLGQRLDLLRSYSPKSCKFPEIIVGGGVRSNNIQHLWETSHAQVFHSSALISSSENVAIHEVERLRDILRGSFLNRKALPQIKNDANTPTYHS